MRMIVSQFRQETVYLLAQGEGMRGIPSNHRHRANFLRIGLMMKESVELDNTLGGTALYFTTPPPT